MASSSTDVGSLPVAGPSCEEAAELSCKCKSTCSRKRVGQSTRSCPCKRTAGCVRLQASVELVQSLFRAKNLWQYQAQQPNKKVQAAPAKTKK